MIKNKQTMLLWGIFVVYSVLTLLAALNHEMWLDEAQAWVILRDCPLSELPRRLNIEGHPPLWYLVLYPFVKFGFPVDYASLISWFFMAAGALVLLFKVELPFSLKAAILASSGFLYFNSVMLRVYCLIPPLMFLILWLYPKRGQHPVLYGLIIALLANTHLFISGIVGMLGIFMIYELFSQWKSSGSKENIGRMIGLFIAGVGVLVLVLPLVGSIENNGTTFMERLPDSRNYILALSEVPAEAGQNNILFSESDGIVCFIISNLFCIVFWVMVVMLRHWKKAFAIEISFLLIYCFLCEYVMITLPNRASIFLLTLAFAFCLAQYEKPVFKSYKSAANAGKIMDWIVKIDNNSKNVYAKILTILFVLAIPSGLVYLFRDITGNFCGSKEMAAYISENFDSDTTFFALGRSMPELSVYDPNIKVFNVNLCDFDTYCKWEYKYRPKEEPDAVMKKLLEYDKLYCIDYYVEDDPIYGTPIYVANGILSYNEKNSIAIYEYNENLLTNYFYLLEEYLKSTGDDQE